MGCTLKNVISKLSECEENFSGVGSRMYFFLVNDLKGTPQRAEDEAAFTEDSFSSLVGKLYAVDIKEQSGQVTTESTPDGGGFSNVCVFTVAKNMDKYAHNLRTLNNQKFGAFCPDGKGGYYAFYSVMGSATLSNSGDSGNTFDSDHGHTTTLTAAPMYYPFMKWNPKSGATLSPKTGVTLYTRELTTVDGQETMEYTAVTNTDTYSSATEYFINENGDRAVLGVHYTIEDGSPINLDDWCAVNPSTEQ